MNTLDTRTEHFGAFSGVFRGDPSSDLQLLFINPKPSLSIACILSNIDPFFTMEWIGVGLVLFSSTETGLDPQLAK